MTQVGRTLEQMQTATQKKKTDAQQSLMNTHSVSDSAKILSVFYDNMIFRINDPDVIIKIDVSMWIFTLGMISGRGSWDYGCALKGGDVIEMPIDKNLLSTINKNADW